jgi:Beta-lactamase enzyme family
MVTPHQAPTSQHVETMDMRRVLLGVAVTGSIALVGAVISLADTSPPPSMRIVKSSTRRAAAPLATAPPATPLLATAVSTLTAADEDDVSVAVENLGTGAAASYNVSDKYVTASIVKLDILCTLLYQAQLSGRSPSDSEVSLITTMIENSNNDAAQRLFDDEGGAPAITAANKVFGLTDTAVEKNSVDEAGYSWGDTTTTVVDQLQLLRQIFTTSSVLNASNRSYIESLMGEVESDQRWGISAAADDPSPSGSDYMLKNGWLPRRITQLWEINSIGEVQYHGQQYLVAVLSSNNKTMNSGISVVQQIAKAAVDSRA